MTQVQDVMTADPQTVTPDTPISQVAAIMRDNDTGFVPIVDGDTLEGVVTDRDIVIRAIADGRSPDECTARDVCSREVLTIEPSEDANAAARQMRQGHVRRVAVTEKKRLVGVVAIGDLAPELDPDSALADISTAPADH